MPKITRYTKDEEELILYNALKKANKMSYEELAKKLNRTVEGIRKKELDLKRKHLSNKRLNRKWTDKEIETITEILNRDSFTIEDLKVIKGRDINIIKEKALEIRTNNIRNNQYNKPWTEEDYDYLKRWWGLEDVTTIGIMLGRSREALRNKAKKLGICSKKIYYTARECSIMLGMSDSRFLGYLQKGYVKSRKAKTEQLIHQIKPQELLDFMEKHQDKWDSRKMTSEPFFIEKPDWYIEKCKRDKENPIDYLDTQKKWTDDEYKYLLEAKKQGMSFEEIAKELDRTVSSVKSKYEKRNTVERRRKEREAKKEAERIKENDYKNLNRLNEEYENENSYILKKVYKIDARKITEDDMELCSNLRMIGYDCKEIAKMVGIGHRFLVNKFAELKDEEYIVYIYKKDFTEDDKQKLLNAIREDYSLYELCIMFNKTYTKIINTYEQILEDLYEEKKDYYWDIETDIKLMLLKAQGEKIGVIIKTLKYSKNAIYGRIKRLTEIKKYTPDDNRGFTKDEDKLIRIYFEKDLDINNLCSITKRSKECILKRYEDIRGK